MLPPQAAFILSEETRASTIYLHKAVLDRGRGLEQRDCTIYAVNIDKSPPPIHAHTYTYTFKQS